MKSLTPALEEAPMIDEVRWMSEPVKAHITVCVPVRWVSSSDAEKSVWTWVALGCPFWCLWLWMCSWLCTWLPEDVRSTKVSRVRTVTSRLGSWHSVCNKWARIGDVGVFKLVNQSSFRYEKEVKGGLITWEHRSDNLRLQPKLYFRVQTLLQYIIVNLRKVVESISLFLCCSAQRERGCTSSRRSGILALLSVTKECTDKALIQLSFNCDTDQKYVVAYFASKMKSNASSSSSAQQEKQLYHISDRPTID